MLFLHDDEHQRPTARGRRRRRNCHARLILEVPDDDADEESDDDTSDELPLRPMSRFHKACIDVRIVCIYAPART